MKEMTGSGKGTVRVRTPKWNHGNFTRVAVGWCGGANVALGWTVAPVEDITFNVYTNSKTIARHNEFRTSIADGEDARESRKRGKASGKEAQLCRHEEEGKRRRRLSGL